MPGGFGGFGCHSSCWQIISYLRWQMFRDIIGPLYHPISDARFCNPFEARLSFCWGDRMHPVRPLRSLFHPAVFISMLGQAQQNSWRLKTHLTAFLQPNNGAKFLAPLSVCTRQAAIHLFCMVLSLVSFSLGICRKETLEIRKFDEHVGTSSNQGGCSANGSCSHGRRLSRKTIRRGIVN